MKRTVVTGALALLLCGTALLPAASTFLSDAEAQVQTVAADESPDPVSFDAEIDALSGIAGPAFTDVNDADWFAEFVRSIASFRIVSGYRRADGSLTGEYRPANPVTVAEALKMVYEAAGQDPTLCHRPAVHPQARYHWASAYVSCAEERQMRLFQTVDLDLNRPVKRAELLTMIHDAFGDRVLPFYSQFRDTQGHKYEADIAYAVGRGIVSGDLDIAGKPTGSFRPDANINRAETAKILYTRLSVRIAEQNRY